MSNAYDARCVEEPDAQAIKIRKTPKLMRGLRALEREYEEFVEVSRQTLALSQELKGKLR
jgi:hypothetical protein